MILRLAKISFFLLASFLSAQSVQAQLIRDNMDQNADQSQGQYQPMNMGYAGFNSLGMTQSAWLDPLQNLGEGQSKPAYSKYYWSPDLVLPIRVREGMLTLVNFPEWEMVEDIYIGDNATFDGQISGPNTILLYPKKGSNVGVDTNIIVFGRSGNRYVFYIKSEGVNTERLTNSIIDIEVIDSASAGASGSSASGFGRGGSQGGSANFTNSNKSLASTYTKRNQKDDWLKTIPVDPEKFRFDIEIYVPNPEDVLIAPERVWRDDIFTYIDLGEKALNMAQRPIVTMIVERVEIPVGFRAKGPNQRLIVVEGIGDMVLRNGKRLVCLKMRRSDDRGLEYATYSDQGQGRLPPEWDVPPPLPDSNASSFAGSAEVPYRQTIQTGAGGNRAGAGGGTYSAQSTTGDSFEFDGQSSAGGNSGSRGGNNFGAGSGSNFDYGSMHRIQNNQQYPGQNSSSFDGYKFGSGFVDTSGSNISIELGTDANVEKLEALWSDLSSKYPEVLNPYEPFFSVDAPADGQGRELFHLRVGPVKSLEAGDNVCSRLGRNGIFCSVVRTQ